MISSILFEDESIRKKKCDLTVTGFEPATSRLQAEHATGAPHGPGTIFSSKKKIKRDTFSNPLGLRLHLSTSTTGFEPVTSQFVAERATVTLHGPVWRFLIRNCFRNNFKRTYFAVTNRMKENVSQLQQTEKK